MDTDEALADATLRRMLREVRPEWSLREAAAADEGTDVVYFLDVETPDGPRECVLKSCEFLDPEAFRPEPYLMTLADRRTSIPVPNVLGAVDDCDDRNDLPAPFFLMERRAGEVCENEARDLPADAIVRLAGDAGRWLGELHDVGDFERFGPVRLARDVDRRADSGGPSEIGGGLAVDGRTITVGEAATDSWRDRVESMADGYLGDLHERFADLEPELRGFIEERLDALDGEFAPVPGHDDYRLGNLLVDPTTGETRAVLDWGNTHTLEAQYNLVVTEQYLGGWALRDDPQRERVRTALREGYRETREVRKDPDFERRRDLYLAVTRLFPLVCFSLWYGDFPEAEREAAADRNRRAVVDLAG